MLPVLNNLRHKRRQKKKRMKTTNDDCVHTWGNKKNGRAGTNISKVSQPPTGPRIRAA